MPKTSKITCENRTKEAKVSKPTKLMDSNPVSKIKAPKQSTTLAKRQRLLVLKSLKTVPKQSQLGRDHRTLAENPVLTTKTSRTWNDPLKYLIKLTTNYKTVSGNSSTVARTSQILNSNREICPLDQDTLSTLSNTYHNRDDIEMDGDTITRTQWMIIPEFLSEELWIRHKYSILDIHKTIDAFSARVLWRLVLSYSGAATNASSKILSDIDGKLTFGGKPTAVQKLLAIIAEKYPDWVDRPSVTWNMCKVDDMNGDGQPYDVMDRHVPGLPVHRIERESFDYLVKNIVYWFNDTNNNINHNNSVERGQNEQDTIMTNAATPSIKIEPDQVDTGASPSTKIAPSIFSWRSIYIVPLELNKKRDMLLVGRVIPWDMYLRVYGLPDSLKRCPNFVKTVDGYYALLDESFYFYAPKNILT